MENNNKPLEQPEVQQSTAEPSPAEAVAAVVPPSSKKFRINSHIVMLGVLVVVVGIIIFQLKNWGVFIDQNELFEDGLGEYSDTLDIMVPLLDENGNPIIKDSDKPLNILVFGNAPFADDREEPDSLANIIHEMTGANIYNCAISESYMAMGGDDLYMDITPLDSFTPYWLAVWGSTGTNGITFENAQRNLGENMPADAMDAVKTLEEVNFDDLDVIVFAYDATDYLLGHRMYSDENSTDVFQFTGNLEASIEFLQQQHPHVRIIVLSPPYAFSDVVDENGEYVSSDVTRYGQDVLSTYVIKEYTSCASRQVTFVDNLYGTITEDNAKDYLLDNLHLNVEGRRLIAQRFVQALYYFNQ